MCNVAAQVTFILRRFLGPTLSTSFRITTGKVFRWTTLLLAFDSLEVEAKWEIAPVAAKIVGQVSDFVLIEIWIFHQCKWSVHLTFNDIIFMFFKERSRTGLYEPLLQENERHAIAELLQYLESMLKCHPY